MILERELVVYNNKQTGIKAYVNIDPTTDPIVRFVKFCIKSNEEFMDTRIYLIDCLNSFRDQSNEDTNSFLSHLINIDSIKGDNNVIYILRTHKLNLVKKDLSSSGFLHFLFDETVEIERRDTEYFICDYAQIGIASIIADMQSKLIRSGEKWH